MWEEDFVPRLTQNERARAGAATLNLPLMSEDLYPLQCYSYPDLRQVFLPIATVKFLDDMAVAYAYYDRMGCDLGVISDYSTVLRFRPQDAKGSPLNSLGVPPTALNDKYVDNTSQNILKSTVFFIIAHEYAHVMYRHTYKGITEEEAQKHEMDADAFALEVMRRIGVPPVGMTFYFLIQSRMEPIPGDPDYQRYCRLPHTHPLSALRILKVAEGIEAHVDDFARLQKDPLSWEKRLRGDATKVREIARTLADPQMRRFLSAKAQSADIAAFRHACAP
jgi:hypothetical protein